MHFFKWFLCHTLTIIVYTFYIYLFFHFFIHIQCPWQLHSHFAIEWSLHRVSKEKSCKLFYTLFVIYLIHIWINSANPKKDRYEKKQQKNKIMIEKRHTEITTMEDDVDDEEIIEKKTNIKKHLRWCHWIVKIKSIRKSVCKS